MPSPTRRLRRPPPHLRISLVGFGKVTRWLVRPLISHVTTHAEATFEIKIIDGNGEASGRMAEDKPSPGVSLIPKYLVQGNIADLIGDGDFVFVAVDNCATVKLISDHAEKLKNVTVIAGLCDWCDGMVQLHVRRGGKNQTPPFANKYHPEFVTPTDRNPGDVPAAELKVAVDKPRSIAACNMVAGLMLVLFQRVQSGVFGKTLPENSDFYLDANQGKVLGRARPE